jgi:hypothetical protein
MTDVEISSAEFEHPLYLLGLPGATPEIQVKSRLLEGWIGHSLETDVENRSAFNGETRLEASGLVG